MSTVTAQQTPDELVLNNIGLVGSVAKRVSQTTGAEYLELFQEGSIGLIKAARSFSENRGFKFATYANRCILNHMLDYLKKGRRDVRCDSLEMIPHWYDKAGGYVADLSRVEVDMKALQKMSTRQKQLMLLLASGYNQREAADEMGITTSTVQRLIQKARSSYEQASGYSF